MSETVSMDVHHHNIPITIPYRTELCPQHHDDIGTVLPVRYRKVPYRTYICGKIIFQKNEWYGKKRIIQE